MGDFPSENGLPGNKRMTVLGVNGARDNQAHLKKLQPRNEASADNHTMGSSLELYLQIKVHQAAVERAYKEIVVMGSYARYSTTSIAFDGEKRDKPFNWERPTARPDGDTLLIECFPGYDHIEHYAEIISCYLRLLHEKGAALTPPSRVFFLPTSCSDVRSALEATNLPHFPGSGVHTVVLGLVWHLPRLTESHDWSGEGPWQWILRSFGKRKVAFLGFRPAFWGNISGEVIHYLASHFDIREIIYLGKLGVLKPNVRPNSFLATGSQSLVHGCVVKWDNVLAEAVAQEASQCTLVGTHITLGSVLHETKDWHAEHVHYIDFVDPEIGMMAQAAIRSGLRFGYLHMITDNLGQKYDEDLSNERIESVLQGRAHLHHVMQNVVENYLSS